MYHLLLFTSLFMCPLSVKGRTKNERNCTIIILTSKMILTVDSYKSKSEGLCIDKYPKNTWIAKVSFVVKITLFKNFSQKSLNAILSIRYFFTNYNITRSKLCFTLF